MTDIEKKILDNKALSLEEGLSLYKHASLSKLMFLADNIRYNKHPKKEVSWIIDRNINITNVCISFCKFCNFCTKKGAANQYTTTIGQYKTKIDELISLGGNQILLQGGMNPDLGIEFYIDLFSQLKSLYPNLKLHALGPPEVFYLAQKANISIAKALDSLVKAGLDSLPGAGAEILSDRVRKIVSPAKCTSGQWLNVMEEAHKINLPTSATMMFGYIETIEERLQHLIMLRETQAKKPKDSYGFLSFIPWPIQIANTRMENYDFPPITSSEYIRFIAISRIMLNNIDNIQASWLTVGMETAQICLSAGANDMGSIMIEENVLIGTGCNNTSNKDLMVNIINKAGFKAWQRDQCFKKR